MNKAEIERCPPRFQESREQRIQSNGARGVFLRFLYQNAHAVHDKSGPHALDVCEERSLVFHVDRIPVGGRTACNGGYGMAGLYEVDPGDMADHSIGAENDYPCHVTLSRPSGGR